MSETHSTSHLVDDVAARTGLPKAQAKRAVAAMVEVLGERLAGGERIQISGLGAFEVRERAARQATNPRTGRRSRCRHPARSAFARPRPSGAASAAPRNKPALLRRPVGGSKTLQPGVWM